MRKHFYLGVEGYHVSNDDNDVVEDDDDDHNGGGNADDDDSDVDDGYPAHSHHDKIPPWWGNVSNDKGGNMSVTKSHYA